MPAWTTAQVKPLVLLTCSSSRQINILNDLSLNVNSFPANLPDKATGKDCKTLGAYYPYISFCGFDSNIHDVSPIDDQR